MDESITILVKENCFRCDFVKKLLNKKGVPYISRNLNDFDDDFIEGLKSDGLLSAPILIYKGERKAGVDMVLIEKVIADNKK